MRDSRGTGAGAGTATAGAGTPGEYGVPGDTGVMMGSAGEPVECTDDSRTDDSRTDDGLGTLGTAGAMGGGAEPRVRCRASSAIG